jgi:hypothetical protein
MELGYQATEFRGTIALAAGSSSGLPPLHHHFFEFVEQSAWDDGNPDFLTLEALDIGKRYYVVITTAAGLYRYFMNDLIEVTGVFHQTPLLRFVQKGKGVTNITGEKLYEAQVIEAVLQTFARFGLPSRFFLLLADEENAMYHLLIELEGTPALHAPMVAAAVDQRLGELNVEYHGKRASGRLHPVALQWLRRGAAEAHKQACVRSGQREGQFKPAILQYRRDLKLDLDDFVIR